MKFINETVVQGGASEFILEAINQKNGSKVELTQEEVGFLTDFEGNELVRNISTYSLFVEDAYGDADGTIRVVRKRQDQDVSIDEETTFDFVIKD